MKEVKFSDLYLEPSKNGLSIKFVDDETGYRIVNMKELFGYPVLNDSIEMRRVKLNSNELKRFSLIKGDLLFGRRSLVFEGAGKSSLYNGEDKNVIFESSIIRVRVDPLKASPEFIKYLFQSSYGKSKIWSIIAGTAVFGIRGSDLMNLKINIPAPKIQEKIASVLTAYDELIENNNQRIKLLEEMAEEIYKEWFVRLRFPGYESTRFFDAEGKEVPHGTVGALPEGWENGSIGSLYQVKSGFAFKSEYLGDFGVPIIKIKNINDLGVDTIKCDRYSGEINLRVKKFELLNGDLLVAMTGATIGKIALFNTKKEPFYLNQRVGKFFSNHIWLKNQVFVYQYTKTITFKDTIDNYALGAAQPNISGEQIENIKLLIPNKELLITYCELTGIMVDEIFILKDKNQLLQNTRDLLLPRLICGKLSVEHLLDEEENLSIAVEPEYAYGKN